jgi:chromosome segregation protein
MNYLKKLELQGFKSFAAKTVLEFPERITAIVGPNGSGKSNVIDALRWVLGEREAKQLRGNTLQNLIFAGTPKHPAVGLAKVSLYFHNKNLLPLDFEEVELSRRVDRSGNSQFFCNNAEIRLKDLIPMLARARLGTRGLNIIGQGESDVFVRSSPQERRLMIEEILGLREFRIKKNQALRRLANSQINMEKVKAMIQELAPHLKILRRQKSRFERRREIENQLREFENTYFASRLAEINAHLDALTPQLENLETALEAKRKEVAAAEGKLKTIDERAFNAAENFSLREKINSLLAQKTSLEKELARIEVKKEFQSAEKGHSVQELMAIIKNIIKDFDNALGFETVAEIKDLIKNWLKKLRALFENGESFIAALAGEEQRIKNEIAVLDGKIQELRAEEESLVLRQENFNQVFRKEFEILESKKDEEKALEQRLQNLRFEKEKILMRLDELQQNWQAIGRRPEELKNLTYPAEIVPADLERKIMRLRGELAAIGEIDASLIKEAEESEKRYEFLSRELEDLEKAAKDLKNLIKDLDRKIHDDFKEAFHTINEEFNKYFRLMFGGGRAKLKLETPKIDSQPTTTAAAPNVAEDIKESELKEVKSELGEEESVAGVEIDLNLPRKKITSLEMLSGGEKSLVSLAALFALISVSPPPFLVLDEIDAALDEVNAQRFADLIREFAHRTQFIIVTHNRATMEAANVLYGITMGEDGVSKVLSLKLDKTSELKVS